MSNIPIEIERKFLISMPDIEQLKRQSNSRVRKMIQTYLICEKEKKARIRKIEENGNITYVKTVKERISALSCFEDERNITEIEYETLLEIADKSKESINKTRYSFEYCGHIIEIDVYGFWSDRAILEVELSSEDESFSIPEFIKIIKEVSEDTRYKNTNLAKSVPYDEI